MLFLSIIFFSPKFYNIGDGLVLQGMRLKNISLRYNWVLFCAKS